MAPKKMHLLSACVWGMQGGTNMPRWGFEDCRPGSWKLGVLVSERDSWHSDWPRTTGVSPEGRHPPPPPHLPKWGFQAQGEMGREEAWWEVGIHLPRHLPEEGPLLPVRGSM